MNMSYERQKETEKAECVARTEPVAWIMQNSQGELITITQQKLDSLTQEWAYIRDIWKGATPLYAAPVPPEKAEQECKRCEGWEQVEIGLNREIADLTAKLAIERSQKSDAQATIAQQAEALKLAKFAIKGLLDYPPDNDIHADFDIRSADIALAAIAEVEGSKHD